MMIKKRTEERPKRKRGVRSDNLNFARGVNRFVLPKKNKTENERKDSDKT